MGRYDGLYAPRIRGPGTTALRPPGCRAEERFRRGVAGGAEGHTRPPPIHGLVRPVEPRSALAASQGTLARQSLRPRRSQVRCRGAECSHCAGALGSAAKAAKSINSIDEQSHTAVRDRRTKGVRLIQGSRAASARIRSRCISSTRNSSEWPPLVREVCSVANWQPIRSVQQSRCASRQSLIARSPHNGRG